MLKSLLISSLILNIGILFGRLSGFVRESFMASVYGVGSEADIVVLMLSVPDILVNILMGGALGAVLIPEFTRTPETARRLLYQSTLYFGLLFLLLTVFLYFNMEYLVSLLAPGFNSAQLNTSIEVIRWVVWLVPLTVMSGATTAFLQAKNQYAIPAMGTLMVNCSIILGLETVRKVDGGLYLLSLFVLIGGVLRLASQIVRIGNITLSPLKSIKQFLISKALIVRYIQAVISGSTLLLFPVIARSQATYLEDGSVSVLNYATKLVEFPLALTVTFLSVVLLPPLSKSYYGNADVHEKTVKYGMQVTLVLSILVASSLSAISESYSSVVFGYGRITSEDINSISGLASLGMLLLPLIGMSTYLTSVFNSRQNTQTPLFVNLSGLISFVLICKSGIYGDDLRAVMLSMISGYALISIFLLSLLRIDNIKWLKVLLEIKFIFSALISSVLVYKICSEIQELSLSNWQTIVLSALVSSLFLTIITLLNNEVRERLIVKMRNL
ncbi:murein biosynthesis integral membrane protein MurJ [Endozoicomonas ascidiicola]|uniref:murein biosynthesis integral membrane protein MurJ n=1 Tax=Endozoicomonas ascidiicola TaxID=1698521 RepID=UPI000832EC7A|nr:lipid II flippase MurJ [Endozoicomonas ascidiicola]